MNPHSNTHAWQLVAGMMVLQLTGCATPQIPLEKAAWAQSMSEQIAKASDSHYIYFEARNKQERQLVEFLANQEGKWTQRIDQHGKMIVCVFVYPPFFCSQ